MYTRTWSWFSFKVRELVVKLVFALPELGGWPDLKFTNLESISGLFCRGELGFRLGLEMCRFIVGFRLEPGLVIELWSV